MTLRQPISTAPNNGEKVIVHWVDADGQENESVAQYRSLEKLTAIGGDWSEADAGWWAFIDATTQKKIEPVSWTDGSEDE